MTRKVAELRPLKVMQTSARLVAAAANRRLAEIASPTVCGQSRRFIQGRQLLDIVIELEDGMTEHFQAADHLSWVFRARG